MLFAKCHYAQCHYAECRYSECHHAECRGAVDITLFFIFFSFLSVSCKKLSHLNPIPQTVVKPKKSFSNKSFFLRKKEKQL
jgi:hypothetical protein